MCGGEVIIDQREGHSVCLECGTVHDQWTCKEDHEFERHANVCQEDLVRGDRKAKKNSGMQELVRSLAMHHAMGTAITEAACDVAGFVDASTIQHHSLYAWALICVGGEIVRSGLQMSVMAKAAEVPVHKLLSAMATIRAQVKHMLPETACADTNDTLNAVTKILESVFTSQEKAKKIEARKFISRLAEVAADNAPFMNITALTRARVLVSEFLRCHGGLTKDQKRALQYDSSGVRNGFKKLMASTRVRV
jgi:hypothetical protein